MEVKILLRTMRCVLGRHGLIYQNYVRARRMYIDTYVHVSMGKDDVTVM